MKDKVSRIKAKDRRMNDRDGGRIGGPSLILQTLVFLLSRGGISFMLPRAKRRKTSWMKRGPATGRRSESFSPSTTTTSGCWPRSSIGTTLRLRLDPSDLVQETFLEAHRDFPRFTGPTERELLAWLRRILARNLVDQRAASEGPASATNAARCRWRSLLEQSSRGAGGAGGDGHVAQRCRGAGRAGRAPGQRPWPACRPTIAR